jgi:hypothetical protein
VIAIRDKRSHGKPMVHERLVAKAIAALRAAGKAEAIVRTKRSDAPWG